MTAARMSAALGIFAFAAGLLTLAGWALGLRPLTAWDGAVSQMPNNALAAAAAGAGLICWWRGWRRAAALLGGLAALLGAATLFEHATNIDLGIDRVLFFRPEWQRGTVAPGRMGIPGSISLVLIGVAIAARALRRAEGWAVAGGLVAMALATLSIIGYLFSADQLYMIPKLTTIALQTATLLLALGTALVLSVPERPPMSVLLGDSAASLLLRRTLPGLVPLLVALGWLSLQAHNEGLFDAEFAIAALVFVLIVIQTVVVWRAGGAIAVHEAEVRESERKFALLFQKAAFGAVLTTRDGVFVDVNDAFVKMLGYARGELLGRNARELGLATAAGAHDSETQLVTKSGAARTFLFDTAPIELGSAPHVLTTLQDITERKAAEDALRASSEALRAADRMKDEFLATLSHELRTPLTAIIGWSQILLNSDLDTREQRIALEAIRSSARAQAQLTDDILDVSRITTGKMHLQRQWADLAAVVDAAVATIRPAAEGKRVPLQVTVDRNLPPYFVDPERLQQVVWNLLTNAIKFSPAGAVVEVALRGSEAGAVIEVIDSGAGISPAFLPHVFERFRQADSSATRAHAGLGIGLALSKDLVELHGGRIEVESEEGRGSRFTVRLPPPPARDDAAPAATSAPQASLRGVRVLYVDDREDARTLIGTMLRRHGADVVQACSADEALAMLADAQPHVVVTDLAMPQRDGYDLLAAVRADPRWTRLPILALTAQGRIDDEARAAGAGFQAFLRKPIDAQDLAAAVARAAGEQAASTTAI